MEEGYYKDKYIESLEKESELSSELHKLKDLYNNIIKEITSVKNIEDIEVIKNKLRITREYNSSYNIEKPDDYNIIIENSMNNNYITINNNNPIERRCKTCYKVKGINSFSNSKKYNSFVLTCYGCRKAVQRRNFAVGSSMERIKPLITNKNDENNNDNILNNEEIEGILCKKCNNYKSEESFISRIKTVKMTGHYKNKENIRYINKKYKYCDICREK